MDAPTTRLLCKGPIIMKIPYTNKSRVAVDREFMYIGAAGPGRADGRKAGRTGGRKGRFGAQVSICIEKMKKLLCKHAIEHCFLTFQITQTRKYRYLLFKTRFLGTAADPADPAEMEPELRLATHQQGAGGTDDVSLNKLPQIKKTRGISRRLDLLV